MSWIQFTPRRPPKKRANSTAGLLAGRVVFPGQTDGAPPAGFEPAFPPPEAGRTLIMRFSGVSLSCLP